MAVTCGFYNSIGSDRKYDALQMSSIFDGVILDGVFMSIGGKLIVTPGTGLNVIVGSGRAWFNHTWTYNDTPLILAISSPEAVYPRIDAVVLEVNSLDEVRNNSIVMVKGVGGANPVRPNLTNNSYVHQYPLAYINVPVGLTQVLASQITNMVGTSSCPFATGAVSGMNIDALIAQWNAEFDEWFDQIKSQLSGDIAGNLQNQINDLADQDDAQALINTDLQNQIDSLESVGAAGGSGWAPTANNWYPDTAHTTGYAYINPPSNCDPNIKIPLGCKIRYEQPHSLAAYFPFNGDPFPDVGTFTPTNIGTPTYRLFTDSARETYNHHAISFTGAEGIAIGGTLTPFKPTGDFSVSFMLHDSSDISSNQHLVGTIFQSGTWEGKYGFSISIDGDGALAFTIGNGVSAYTLISGAMYHYIQFGFAKIVCTFRKGVMKIYVNSTLDASLSTGVSVAYHPTEHYVRFGCAVSASGGQTHANYLGRTAYLDEFIFLNDVAIDRVTVRDMYAEDQIEFGNGPIRVTKFGIATHETIGKGRIYMYQGTDYNIVSGDRKTVPTLWYSTAQFPEGFPKTPDTWAMYITNSVRKSQSNPASGNWYDLETLSWGESMYEFYPPHWNISLDLIVSIAGPASGTEVSVGVYDSSVNGVLLKGQTIFLPLASYRMPVHIDIPFCTVLPELIRVKVGNTGVTSVALENAISSLKIKAVCAYL